MVRNYDYCSYRAANNHSGLGLMVAEIKRNLHPRISAAHNEDLLSPVILAGLVIRGVNNFPGEVLQPVNFRHHRLGVLTRGDDEPLAEILNLGAVAADSPDPPQTASVVVLSRLNALVEVGVDVEAGGVGLKVFDELPLRRVVGIVVGEWEMGKLAELLGEMKLQAIVGALLPQ